MSAMVDSVAVSILEDVNGKNMSIDNNNVQTERVSEAITDNVIDSFVREINIPKLTNNGYCGFHLSRSKWDPYPWVSRVDKGSTAELSGLKNGDCVLEVNGEDILGLRIADIANLVKIKSDSVVLLLWTNQIQPLCSSDSLCCGPMPQNLERLSICVQTMLNALECPICLDIIPPPAVQCINGHLVCVRCKVKSEKCAVCRQRYSAGRSLIAEQLFNAIRDAFKLNGNANGKIKDKLFGVNCRKLTDNAKLVQSHTHKFLARIMGKASSLDNLSNSKKELGDNSHKEKQLCLSANDIFRTNLSAPTSRSTSPHRLTPEIGAQSIFGNRRPPSINTSSSAESLNNDHNNTLIPSDGTPHPPPPQLIIPKFTVNDKMYYCPCGNYCVAKIKALELRDHIGTVHNCPIVMFQSASAKINLPPRPPIDEACLQLILDGRHFWLRISAIDGEYFVSALCEGSVKESDRYALEVIIRNSIDTDVFTKPIVKHYLVNSLEKNSWMDLQVNKTGIVITEETLDCSLNDSIDIEINILYK